MSKFLPIIQVAVSVLLIILILLQQRGTGLGGAFGGTGDVYSTKRGVEKIIFTTTIILSIIFLGTALLALFF